jgi:hypothetical protein
VQFKVGVEIRFVIVVTTRGSKERTDQRLESDKTITDAPSQTSRRTYPAQEICGRRADVALAIDEAAGGPSATHIR